MYRKSRYKKLKSFAGQIKPYLIAICVYGFYLLILPNVVALLVPCLKRLPGQVYELEFCTTTYALDRFLWLALLGAVILILWLFFKIYKRSLKAIGITSVILGFLTIVSYYKYAPLFELGVKRAPIFLESLLHEK